MNLFFLIVSLYSIQRSTAEAGLRVQQRWNVEHFCFRRLNNTHEVGCSSSFAGDVGIVHKVSTDEDVDFVTSSGPDALFVAFMNVIDLSTERLDKFAASKRVVGVVAKLTSTKPQSFSSDDTCPNRYSSYYNNASDSCNWNTENPMSNAAMKNYPFPIFLLTNETVIDDIEKCTDSFNKKINNSIVSERKCALKLYSPMNAAKNSEVCTRRSAIPSYFTYPVRLCDPLENRNVFTLFHGNTNSPNSTKSDPSTVVIAGRMDASSMFSGLVPGADSAVSNIVSLIVLTDALNRIRDKVNLQKNILLALFNGEAFDYIGSSRFIHELKQGEFEYNLTLADIYAVIELNQVFQEGVNDSWFAHIDRNQNKTGSLTNKILNSLSQENVITPVVGASLPPSSVQSILKANKDIPVVVITNHERAFTNKFYNSIYDDASSGDRSSQKQNLQKQAQSITKLVNKVLTSVLELTAENSSEKVDVNATLAEDLLNCFIANSSCDSFREALDYRNTDLLRDTPYPLYITVGGYSSKSTPATIFSYLLMVRSSGRVAQNVTSLQDCIRLNIDPSVHSNYTWMGGETTGSCIAHNASLTIARSPIFDFNDDNSPSMRYSTWTESVWQNVELSLFVKASLQNRITSLIVGVIILTSSFSMSFFVHRNVKDIFDQTSPVAC